MQIKVNSIKNHSVNVSIGCSGDTPKGITHEQWRTFPVAEAKLVLVASDEASQLVRTKEGKLWFNPVYSVKSNLAFPVKPILISLTEKIEGGDWYYANETLFKADEKLYHGNDPNTIKNQFKVLALPEHFSPEQLQMIVDGKLKDGDKVLIGCEKFEYANHMEWFEIKLNSSNHITIHKVEEKMVPLSSVIKAFEGVGIIKISGLFVEEWFEQNVK